jgi:hypothetical protein
MNDSPSSFVMRCQALASAWHLRCFMAWVDSVAKVPLTFRQSQVTDRGRMKPLTSVRGFFCSTLVIPHWSDLFVQSLKQVATPLIITSPSLATKPRSKGKPEAKAIGLREQSPSSWSSVAP